MLDVSTIILAAGKGTRMKKSDGNKVATLFHGKPLIVWAAETALSYSRSVIVVVGSHEESVRSALAGLPVVYVLQGEQKGTGHAAGLGAAYLQKHSPPKYAVVGYGDHMMFYTPEVIRKFIAAHVSQSAAVSLVTALCENPDSLAYGRIMRTPGGQVARIVEQKDATDEQRNIKEVNAGLYCFDFPFLAENITQITPSPASGEYYLTDMVDIANRQQKKALPFVVPFEQIGYGINSLQDLQKSLELKKLKHNPS